MLPRHVPWGPVVGRRDARPRPARERGGRCARGPHEHEHEIFRRDPDVPRRRRVLIANRRSNGVLPASAMHPTRLDPNGGRLPRPPRQRLGAGNDRLMRDAATDTFSVGGDATNAAPSAGVPGEQLQLGSRAHESHLRRDRQPARRRCHGHHRRAARRRVGPLLGSADSPRRDTPPAHRPSAATLTRPRGTPQKSKHFEPARS